MKPESDKKDEIVKRMDKEYQEKMQICLNDMQPKKLECIPSYNMRPDFLNSMRVKNGKSSNKSTERTSKGEKSHRLMRDSL